MLGLRNAAKKAVVAALAPNTPLNAGSQAPDFELKDQDGTLWRSADLDKHYVLLFYPGDDTPTCTKQLQELNENLARFRELNTQVFGVNPASASSHKRFADKFGYDFPLLVDTDRALALAYRAARPGLPVVFRSLFVVSKGIVRFAARGEPSMTSIMTFCERAEETGYKGTGRRNRTDVPEISSFEFRKLREDEAKLVVLDVRDTVDWRKERIPGSRNAPFGEIDDHLEVLQELGRHRPIVIVDDQGLRSQAAANFMRENGDFPRMFTLVDGMEAYKGERTSEPPEEG